MCPIPMWSQGTRNGKRSAGKFAMIWLRGSCPLRITKTASIDHWQNTVAKFRTLNAFFPV